jgi:HEAT repeat protein
MTMDRSDALNDLKSGDPATRARAARELRAWNDPGLQRALVEALGDASRDVRDAAARTLIEIGDGAAVPPLVELLRSGAPAARNGARQVLEQLCRIEPQALSGLSRDDDARMRLFAANIMGGTGDHDWVPRLMELLGDLEPNVIDASMRALGQLGPREAVASLRVIACHADSWLRFSAIDALGGIPDPLAVRALLELLPSVEPDFLEPLIDALGRQGSVEAVLPLAGMVESRAPLQPALLRVLLGPLAPHVASLGRDPRLAPLARVAAEAMGQNKLPARLATTTPVLLAAIGREGGYA